MIGRTNASTSIWGISAIGSYINVTYPTGSICTCTNGTITLKASNTSGVVSFGIPSAGSWTVSCTNGSKIASKTTNVQINNVYDIKLNYSNYWYKSGTGWILPQTEESTFHNWRYNNYDTYFTYSNSAPDYGGYILHTTNTIDVTNYTTAYIEYTRSLSYDNGTYFGIATDTSATYAAAVNLTNEDTRAILSLDISDIVGNRYLTFSGTVVYGSITVYNMWLD